MARTHRTTHDDSHAFLEGALDDLYDALGGVEVAHHPDLKLVSTRGVGHLAGRAETFANSAIDQIQNDPDFTYAEVERRLIAAAGSLILSLVHLRNVSVAAIQGESTVT